MKVAISRVKHVLIISDTGIIELWVALLTVLWGCWLMMPSETFATHRAYWVLAQQMSENHWGMVFVGMGLLELVSFLFLNYRARKVTAFLLFSLWFYLTAVIYKALPEGSASFVVVMVGAITVLLAWAYIRIGIIMTNGTGATSWNRKNTED